MNSVKTFASLIGLPENLKIRYQPELPKIKIKRGKATYTITDLRLLHPLGKEALISIFNGIISCEEYELSFVVPVDVDDETLEIVNDIVMGFSCDVKRRYSSFEGFRLVSGCTTETNKTTGGRIVTYSVTPDFANFIRSYHQDNGNGTINLLTVVMDFADEQRLKFEEEIKKLHEEEITL